MANEDIKWEDYGNGQTPKIKVSGYEEVPSFESYAPMDESVQKRLNATTYTPPEGEKEVPVGKYIKKPFQALGYGVRKYITNPIYKGVDVVAQKGGNKVAEWFGAKLSDKDKYGDVDFGDNGQRQDYESLGDYYTALNEYPSQKEAYDIEQRYPTMYSVDRYGNYIEPEEGEAPVEPNGRFASLTGTRAYQDWQPTSVAGRAVKKASGIAGDMLPTALEGYAIEKAPLAMGMLSPLGKIYQRAKNKAATYLDQGKVKAASQEMINADVAGRRAKTAYKEGKLLETQGRPQLGWADNYRERADLYRKYRQSRGLDPMNREDFVNAVDDLRYAPQEQKTFMAQKINEARAKNWKPMPNPQAQREAALAKQVRAAGRQTPTMGSEAQIAGDAESASKAARMAELEVKGFQRLSPEEVEWVEANYPEGVAKAFYRRLAMMPSKSDARNVLRLWDAENLSPTGVPRVWAMKRGSLIPHEFSAQPGGWTGPMPLGKKY